MLQIRPVSDLRNKFPDIEKIVNSGEPWGSLWKPAEKLLNPKAERSLVDKAEVSIMERLSVEESIQGKELQVFEQRKYFW